jgi:hypothetical protein
LHDEIDAEEASHARDGRDQDPDDTDAHGHAPQGREQEEPRGRR